MVLHDHAHADEPEDEIAAARNARLGRKLFVVYLVLYLGYMLLTAFRPELLRTLVPGGINLAVAYGIGLIKAAILMALLYAWLCRVPSSAEGKGGR